MSNQKEDIKTIFFEIAGVVVEICSNFQNDIDAMSQYLKHHIIEKQNSIISHHRLRTIGVMHMKLPRDSKHKWTLNYQGMVMPIAHNFIQRIVYKWKYRKQEAVCYYSETTGCDYIKVDNGNFLVINDNVNNETSCYIFEKHFFFSNKNRRSNITSIIPLLLHVILAAHNRYVMHASAVRYSNGAHVFVGKSGSGKSTLCTDLAQHCDGEFMGDDLICIYEQNGTIMAGAMLLDAKLHEESNTQKKTIDMIDERGVKFCRNAPVASFSKMNQTRTGPSTLEPLDDDMKIHEMILSTNNAAMQPDKDNWMSVIINACATVPMFTFNFGDRKLLDKNIFEAI